ncbi:guanylate kinase [Candidatus Bipolaricaulota bacterium]|nr:guanylate kinase [Candidatus Bipolaricaulota bacterium]
MNEFLPRGWGVQGERGIAFVITGPSGAGKSSVIAALLRRDPKLAFSVSATTRPKRPDEVDGRDYYFVSEAAFDRLVAEGKLLEWTTYQGHRYGTPRSEVVDRLALGQDVVLNVEVRGALAILNAGLSHPVVLVFMVPPTRDELIRRIRARGTESPDILQARLAIANEEVKLIPAFHYLVVNDDLAAAVARVEAIVAAERARIVPWPT